MQAAVPVVSFPESVPFGASIDGVRATLSRAVVGALQSKAPARPRHDSVAG